MIGRAKRGTCRMRRDVQEVRVTISGEGGHSSPGNTSNILFCFNAIDNTAVFLYIYKYERGSKFFKRFPGSALSKGLSHKPPT
jgi:hypothetical protein